MASGEGETFGAFLSQIMFHNCSSHIQAVIVVELPHLAFRLRTSVPTVDHLVSYWILLSSHCEFLDSGGLCFRAFFFHCFEFQSLVESFGSVGACEKKAPSISRHLFSHFCLSSVGSLFCPLMQQSCPVCMLCFGSF